MVLLYHVIVSYLEQLENLWAPEKKKCKAQKVLIMLIMRYLAFLREETIPIDSGTYFANLLSFFTSNSKNDPPTFCQLPEISYFCPEQSERRGGWAASYRPRSLPNTPRQSVLYV